MSTINPALIDPTKPEEGAATTQSVRDNMTGCRSNFTAADNEIDSLTSGFSGHVSDNSNPHAVTAAQANAVPYDPGATKNIIATAADIVPLAIKALAGQTERLLRVRLEDATEAFAITSLGEMVSVIRARCTTNNAATVPLDAKGAVGQTASIFEVIDSSNAVLNGFDKDGNFLKGVNSDVTGVAGATAVNNCIALTQAQYNAITPDASTLYLIRG